MAVILTIAVGAGGFIIARALKLPAAAMIGALFAVGIFNVFTGQAYIPAFMKTATQIVAGAFIGAKITRENVSSLKKAVKPALINFFSIIVFGLILGVVVYYISDYDLLTSAFATAPGGLVDMSLIAIDMGADMSVISLLQLIRLLSILGLFPHIIRLMLKRFGKKEKLKEEKDDIMPGESQQEDKPAAISGKQAVIRLAYTLITASAFGIIGKISGIPAGALIFAIIGVAVMNLVFQNAHIPSPVKQGAQLSAGILIGQTVTLSAVLSLKYALIPALVVLLGYIIVSLIIGFVIYKITDLNLATALFACAPGGATDISLMSEDFGAHSPTVTIIQFPRVIAVILLYPPGIALLQALIA